LRSLARSRAEIETQAARLRPLIAKSLGESCTVEVCACESQVGSGALPTDTIASAGLMIRTKNGSGALDRLAAALRGLRRPVIGRIADGGLTFDLRCLTDEQEFVNVISELDADAIWG
jgi:L-seryl-tRNA(Ser) seleniumtransferase